MQKINEINLKGFHIANLNFKINRFNVKVDKLRGDLVKLENCVGRLSPNEKLKADIAIMEASLNLDTEALDILGEKLKLTQDKP